MRKAVCLLSGGLDSYVSLILSRESLRTILALTFDYGQRAAKQEIRAAAKIASYFKIPHRVIALPWLTDLGDNALTQPEKSLPIFDAEKTAESARAVWVPNRNGVFLNIAAAFAESAGAEWILTGFNKEEAATFPDNTADYVDRLNRAFEFSTRNQTQVKSFVQAMTKKEMARILLDWKLPTALTWSCYDGGKKPCGSCESCARYENAFS